VQPRFQADSDFRNAIRLGVLRREPAIDFQSAHTAGLDGLTDSEVLGRAAAQNRILISHDENSMPFHFREWISARNISPGLLMVPQGASSALVIESILTIWIASQADEWRNKILWLPL
jgi:hypothetical protein